MVGYTILNYKPRRKHRSSFQVPDPHEPILSQLGLNASLRLYQILLDRTLAEEAVEESRF